MQYSAKLWAVIPAAGSGKRFSQQQLKQYVHIGSQTVLQHSIQALLHLPLAGYVFAIAEHDDYFKTLTFPQQDLAHHCIGGAERVDSVYHALCYLQQQLNASDDDWVLVHDAARPCVKAESLQALYQQVQHTGQSAILAVPVRDTLKKSSTSQQIEHTVSREQLWQAQTPQMAKLGILKRAIEQAQADGVCITDEASALEHIGEVVHLVQGRADNIKITYADDVRFATFVLQSL